MNQLQQQSLSNIKDPDVANQRAKMKLQEMMNPKGDLVAALETGKSCHVANKI